ncbi:MAG: hypothetical protein ACJ789_21465 [Thermomicrobiales bacterium]
MTTIRTEHRAGGAVTPIAREMVTLTPLISQFTALASNGELIVVDEATEHVIVRFLFGREPEEGDIAQVFPDNIA